MRASTVCLAWLLMSGVALGQVAGDSPEAAPSAVEAPSAAVEPGQADAGPRLVDRLGYRPWVDGPITAAIWVGWLGTEAFKSRLGPETCRWCVPGSLDWGVRNALVWDDPKPARLASDVMLFGVAPLAALGTTIGLAYADGKTPEALWDVLLILEAAGAAAATTQAVKFFVARRRPFVHAALEGGSTEPVEVDGNLSFFSGHSSFTFALAAATATVARMRGRSKGWIALAIGLPLAATTGYLRIAGDKHYLSDVAVGALVGLAVGTVLPAVHDWEAFRGRAVNVALVPVRGGGMGMVGVAW